MAKVTPLFYLSFMTSFANSIGIASTLFLVTVWLS